MGACASKPPPKPNPYAGRDSETDFPPVSPVKAALSEKTLHGNGELDKRFGLSSKFASVFEVEDEIEQGHFGYYTCSAIDKKGALKGEKVAVKIIPKSKMTTAIAIEDVRKEVKILRTLTGHPNILQFYDAFEDDENVYIVMELCEGGDLLARGGKYSEDRAKALIRQILNAVAFIHLHGVAHRDIKPENFLFASNEENCELKVIGLGLSDFVELDEKLNEIVGSAYYVAPEVLRGSYGTEADIWSVGVITYILLCGMQPFWDRKVSALSQEVLKADPSFNEGPWSSLSPESKDFIRCLLNEDPSRRITAAQAMCHPWVRTEEKMKVPLDIRIFKLMKGYMSSSCLRKAALRTLSKTLGVNEVFYLKQQFALMHPDPRGAITLHSFNLALVENATGATKSDIADLLKPLNALQFRRMHFQEFCAAALSVHQLEILENWEYRTRQAYEIFEQQGNRVIVIEELASELGLCPSMSIHRVLQEWVSHEDGRLTLHGFVKLLLT